MLESLFFELLQVALGNRESLSRCLSDEEWQQMMDMSKKQTLLGIAYAGCERLPAEQRPERRMLFRWAGLVNRRVIKNNDLSKKCRMVSAAFRKAGFWSCILKGQSNLENYPEWLSDKRSPGDIDIWVLPEKDEKYPISKVIKFCQKIKKGDYVYYHHVDFPVMKDTEVEVHYRPTWLFNPLDNHRLQEWFRTQARRCAVLSKDGFPRPKAEFDAVYQLLHIYKHLFQDGIGLRQVLDYYMVVSRLNGADVMPVLRRIHVDRFAAALMWVMQRVFAMPDDLLICQPDVRRGEHLLREIMLAGNFGHFDERYGDISNEGHAHRFFRKIGRSARLVTYYPHEAPWQSPFSLYHILWRNLRFWRWQ